MLVDCWLGWMVGLMEEWGEGGTDVRLVGWYAGWLVGCLVGWMYGRSVGWVFGCLADWLVG